MAMKKGILYRFSLVAGPLLFTVLSKMLFATCRVVHHGIGNLRKCEEAKTPFIAAFWHYSVFYVIARSAGKPWVAMVSGSRDGEYVARILQRMGYRAVRGSRGKGGLGALKEMMSFMSNGYNAAIVADGSQGPARVVQAGVILLSSRTGTPILPVAWSADRYWTFSSWDRTVLPRPFSRIDFFYGEPLRVPEKLRSTEIEPSRIELEKRLNDLYGKAWGVYDREEH